MNCHYSELTLEEFGTWPRFQSGQGHEKNKFKSLYDSFLVATD
jgi:hypothetical protein